MKGVLTKLNSLASLRKGVYNTNCSREDLDFTEACTPIEMEYVMPVVETELVLPSNLDNLMGIRLDLYGKDEDELQRFHAQCVEKAPKLYLEFDGLLVHLYNFAYEYEPEEGEAFHTLNDQLEAMLNTLENLQSDLSNLSDEVDVYIQIALEENVTLNKEGQIAMTEKFVSPEILQRCTNLGIGIDWFLVV